jgi:hypothetical protein
MRYGLYDATRGLTVAAAAGVAGLLLWAATLVGQTSTTRFWEEMGIVAAAGLVLSLAHVLGGWTKGLRLRFSPGTFALGFLPVLVCVGWVLMASQPGRGWHEGTIVSWSNGAGLMDVVHNLALWHGVLAFGFGVVLGMAFDAVPVAAPVDEVVTRGRGTPGAEPVDRRAADEPVTAEQREVPADERMRTALVERDREQMAADGRAPTERTPTTMD